MVIVLNLSDIIFEYLDSSTNIIIALLFTNLHHTVASNDRVCKTRVSGNYEQRVIGERKNAIGMLQSIFVQTPSGWCNTLLELS